MTFTPAGERRMVWAGVGVLFIAGCVWLWFLCARNPQINYLSWHRGAEWVIYPKPPEGMVYGDFEVSTVFRRKFKLDQVPGKATLSVRAFKRFEITINGQPATNTLVANANWKEPTALDVASLLHPGTNEISITVFNQKAAPALWAQLNMGSDLISSGPDWEASILGAAWRPAWPAAIPTKLAKGNPLFGGESTFDSLPKSLPMLLGFAVVACALVYFCSKYILQSQTKGSGGGASGPARFMISTVILLGALWAILFLNNLGWLPREVGFDETAHYQYVDYIRTEKSLPLANQGWEMCQPPLYYLIGAGITSSAGVEIGSEQEALVLRLIGLVTGIVHFTLIFLCLRLLFPGCLGAQWFGTMLAACVPEHLYISQYVTNEFLAAALLTGTLYACLRLLKEQRDSWKLALAIGLCAGAALLTKFTPILAMPFIGGILAYRILNHPKGEISARVRTLIIVGVAAFAVAGWHYIRVWIHFGKPVVHDWDAVSGYSWWTDKGFQTFGSFTSFGESLVRPYYSVLYGFGDGIYSTMWGDSFYGGISSWENRPAWNYTLMTAGFLLSLLPTLVILAGFVVCAAKFLKRPEPVWFLLLGLTVTTYAALFYMSLKLPYFCNIKAFYALITLLPMCAFGAAGWKVLCNVAGKLRPILYVMMLVWAMNAYASFWIRSGSSATHTMRANLDSRRGRPADAIAELTEALRINPHDVVAMRFLAAEQARAGNVDAAWQTTKLLLADDPDNASGLLQAALLLAQNGQMDEALQKARRAIEVAPDYALAYQELSDWLSQTGKNQAAADAAREGLRITPFNPQLHALLAASLTKLGEQTEADEQTKTAQTLAASHK